MRSIHHSLLRTGLLASEPGRENSPSAVTPRRTEVRTRSVATATNQGGSERPRITTTGPLDSLLTAPGVTEVMVNAGGHLWVEQDGRLETRGVIAPESLDGFLERLLTTIGRRLDRTQPIVDARLADGSRVCVVVPPVAVDGMCLSIRRFAVRTIAIAEMADSDTLAVIRGLVAARANIVVSGATSSGKTTLLNALTGLIDPHERLVCLEDVAELRPMSSHVVRLETRPGHHDGPAEITLGDLVRAALRLRPDRLLVGEVRGPEALDLLHALNTGHDGSLSTVHANSPPDALTRLGVLAASTGVITRETAAELVHGAIDAVIHVVRGVDGRRRVAEVHEPRRSERWATAPEGHRTPSSVQHLAEGDPRR